MFDAETLLLVHHDQPQFLEPGRCLQQAVGADDDVRGAVSQLHQRLLRLLWSLEPGQLANVDGELAHPFGERVEVLLREQRGRHQYRHLLAVLDRLEGRPDRDLGLAVADVAADEPVHRYRLFHVRLDIFDRGQLVRRLGVGERVLQLALPRGVGPERVPPRVLAGRVELDQLGRDLPYRLARPSLGLLPVGAAHLVQGGALPADVAGQLVQGIGRGEQPVARLAPLAWRVLDDQVFAIGAVDGALDHLHVAADAVLFVHHVVARTQFQRVDRVAPPARHLPHVLCGGTSSTTDVRAGDDGQPATIVDESVLHAAHREEDVAGHGSGVHPVDHPHPETRVAQHLGGPLGRPVPLEDEHGPPTLAGPPLQVVDHPGSFAVVQRSGLGRQHQRPTEIRAHRRQRIGLPLAPRLVHRGALRLAKDSADGPGGGPPDRIQGVHHPEWAQRPPRLAQAGRDRADLGQRLERGRAQVDRRLCARRRSRPARLQELLAGVDEIVCPGSDALRVTEHHHGARRHAVEHQLERAAPVQQRRRQRLHALHRDALGELVQHLGQLGVLLGQVAGPGPDVVGQQQFAAGRRPQPVGLLQGALVGDREGADLLDLVAPELHP